ETPRDWRERWAAEAERYGQAPPPVHYLDRPRTVEEDRPDLIDANRQTVERALSESLRLLTGPVG
ncbi:MAG: hypothetical protein M3301_06945, partial [Chloroflexota bacterium]|nr:hypothetical protein [Chloroflexota bacterium]